MHRKIGDKSGLEALRAFLLRRRRVSPSARLSAASLFSGAGISDLGYQLAGFRFLVQVELDEARAAIGKRNFPDSLWITKDVRLVAKEVAAAYAAASDKRLDLLVATPPCQGMSSSNPSRGKRKTSKAQLNDEKNSLILAIVPIAKAIRPRVIVSENVRQILTHAIHRGDGDVEVMSALEKDLPDYQFFRTCLNVADYGIPQTRCRALVVGVHRQEPWLVRLVANQRFPWPRPTREQAPRDRVLPRVTVQEWFTFMKYPALSARSFEESRDGHLLHVVPYYDADRYSLVADIPPHSGRSAYENDLCHACRSKKVPLGVASCPRCGEPLRNRPIVLQEGGPRLIKGFDSSYRRMRPDEPAPTVMTNSSHVGSDNKIHPWENRVLSALECADLQTVPRFFDWSAAFESRRSYLIRNVIGEAFPSYFTYLHGRVLGRLLRGKPNAFLGLARIE